MSVTVTLMEDTRKEAMNDNSKKGRAQTAEGRLPRVCLARVKFHGRQERYSLVVQSYFRCFTCIGRTSVLAMQVKSKVELDHKRIMVF